MITLSSKIVTLMKMRLSIVFLNISEDKETVN